jgi:hypothetical protein
MEDLRVFVSFDVGARSKPPEKGARVMRAR